MRVGVFGFGESAQLWATGSGSVVLAVYLSSTPYHRVVCEVDDPIMAAATINRWLAHGTSSASPRRLCSPSESTDVVQIVPRA